MTTLEIKDLFGKSEKIEISLDASFEMLKDKIQDTFKITNFKLKNKEDQDISEDFNLERDKVLYLIKGNPSLIYSFEDGVMKESLNGIPTDAGIITIHQWGDFEFENYNFDFRNKYGINFLAKDTLDLRKVSSLWGVLSDKEIIGDISNWDVSNVTNMGGMFHNSIINNETFDISKWNVSNVTNMRYMFWSSTVNSETFDISKWDVSNVTDMRSMFKNSKFNRRNLNISNWDVSSVTNMENMFSESKFNSESLGISNWNVSKVTNMCSMFESSTFNGDIFDISKWNVSKVTNMCRIFKNSTFNGEFVDISTWDTSNVANMNSIFSGSTFSSEAFDISK